MTDCLWAPWRMQYIRNPKPRDARGCIFCTAIEQRGNERENHVLMRDAHVIVIMNRYPYNNGHLMVAPLRHVEDLAALNMEEIRSIFLALRSSLEALRKALRAEGFNVGINIGKLAGAGVQEHLHIHIVPRWLGDVNFMPVISDTHVIPELLTQTYDRLKPFFTSHEG